MGSRPLADALLMATGSLDAREQKAQFLDNMDIERERGITIKAQTVRLKYKAKSGEIYQLNLIDTPGHVDFSYEVSRSLKACEGALLVVDAAQGVEAQTLANVYLAMENDLEIIPVLNKVDLPAADPEKVRQQIEEVIGLDASEAILASAKQGLGVEEILEAVVEKVPAPKVNNDEPLRALVFDSWFDPYQGVVILCRVMEGSLSKKQRIQFMNNKGEYEVLKLGAFSPFAQDLDTIYSGEVGFVVCGIKDIRQVQVGDTITHVKTVNLQPATEALAGFQKVRPMVFAGLFPVQTDNYQPFEVCH